ncbi:hypothetical protein HDV00_008177 [Rhizophlyctis rosea]|nr:hypothetical protein HDV00_008177 [Rhizophlyctis rosea]
MPYQPRIAIVGGGPAGLTLALLLHQRNIPSTVFELRQKPTDAELAKPSGMLDLHFESGQLALRECGLYDQFLKLTGECSESQVVADKDGKIVWLDDGGMSNRPEIARHHLTKLLFTNLPEGTIKYEHKLVSATSSTTPNGNVETTLDFGLNGKHTFDFVVGADGAWSRVRNLVTDVKPSYAGFYYITLNIQHVTSKHPHLAKLIGSGSFTALGFSHGIMSHRGVPDLARLYIFLTTPDENFASTAGLAGQPATAVKKLLEDDALLGRFGPILKKLISVGCDEEAVDNVGGVVEVRPLYKLPVGVSWEHKPGVTLIGDAAHLMPPFAGEGVNLAMWDSLLLAHAIIKAYETGGQDVASFQAALEPLVKEFEVDMAARAGEKAQETQDNGEMMFAETGCENFVNFFRSVFGDEGNKANSTSV